MLTGWYQFVQLLLSFSNHFEDQAPPDADVALLIWSSAEPPKKCDCDCDCQSL